MSNKKLTEEQREFLKSKIKLTEKLSVALWTHSEMYAHNRTSENYFSFRNLAREMEKTQKEIITAIEEWKF